MSGASPLIRLRLSPPTCRAQDRQLSLVPPPLTTIAAGGGHGRSDDPIMDAQAGIILPLPDRSVSEYGALLTSVDPADIVRRQFSRARLGPDRNRRSAEGGTVRYAQGGCCSTRTCGRPQTAPPLSARECGRHSARGRYAAGCENCFRWLRGAGNAAGIEPGPAGRMRSNPAHA